MQALICDDYQGIESLRVGELPEPEPGPGSLLVQVESVVVNFADTLMVSGLYQTRPDTPFAPGYEIAGTVVVSNQCEGFSPGDRVAAFHWYGGMAERIVVLAQNAVRIPDTITSDLAAPIPGTYDTSFHALADRAALRPDERLLVLGAAGGVGSAAIQIGKALGSEVLAAVSSNEKAEFARAQGADQVIRYDETPLRDGIAEATAGDGVDVVFDPVGGESTELALRSTKFNGRILVIGFASGDIPSIPLNLPLVKGNSIVGVFWGRFAMEDPVQHQANLSRLVAMVEDGQLTPSIQKTFPLSEGKEALEWVANRRAIGRVIINP